MRCANELRDLLARERSPLCSPAGSFAQVILSYFAEFLGALVPHMVCGRIQLRTTEMHQRNGQKGGTLDAEEEGS